MYFSLYAGADKSMVEKIMAQEIGSVIGFIFQFKITIADVLALIFVGTIMYGLFRWARFRFFK